MARYDVLVSLCRPCLRCALLFFLFNADTVASAPEGGAKQLVRTAQLDRVAMHILPGFYFASADSSDPVSVKFSRCLAAQDSRVVAAVLADAVNASLSEREIRAALSFYASPLGNKYAAQALRQTQAELGYPVTGPSPRFSVAESKRTTAFSRTSVARKLALDRLLSVDKTGVRLLNQGLPLAAKCSLQPETGLTMPAPRHRFGGTGSCATGRCY